MTATSAPPVRRRVRAEASARELDAIARTMIAEAGVYLPGVGGVRIEDLVVVTADSPEVLTPFTKELRTLR